MSDFQWKGPYKINDLLGLCLEEEKMPPASDAVYLVTRKTWVGSPDESCQPLYVGGNTGKSQRFRTRVGDLIIDAFGFFVDGETGHSSGGQSLHKWCRKHNTHPGNLYIAWATQKEGCARCAEIDLLKTLLTSWNDRKKLGILNVNRPPWCQTHDNSID